MPTNRLVTVIEHPHASVQPGLVIASIRETVAMLEGVDRKLSEEPNLSARWAIVGVTMHSPIAITYAPAPRQKNKPCREIVPPFLEDMDRMERGEIPRYFTPVLQGRARTLLATLDKANSRIRFRSDEQEVAPTARLIANVDDMCAAHEEIGTVEGKLDVIDVHGEDTVRVWDFRSNEAVDCRVSPEQLEQAKSCLGHRMGVRGRIKYERGKPKEVVDVFSIYDLGEIANLPQIDDVAPLDLTGGVEPSEYLRGDEE